MTNGDFGVGSGSLRAPTTSDGLNPNAPILDNAAQVARLREERDALQSLIDLHAGELKNLSCIKEQFIATASHDLKTPLAAILGYTQLATRLLRDPAPNLDKVLAQMAIIQDQARTMSRLLDDLLDASRVQVGDFALRLAPCEIGACLATILARLSPDSRERVDMGQVQAPLTGLWDQRRLELVISNLVGNALKYSPGGDRVHIVADRRGEMLEVTVSDQGMGILASDLPHVFERFFRTSQAQASDLPGSGLGLFISFCIIAAHGGRLWAESPGEGQGATFRFCLPGCLATGDSQQTS
jgi:two-component system, OmpR family, phosphate regulon sensor histidine kinase PhoR